MILVLVLALITPILLAQAMVLHRYGLQAPGITVQKAMERVEVSQDINWGGVARSVTEADLMMMVAIADHGMTDPKYLWLPQLGVRIHFDPSLVTNRQTHIQVMLRFIGSVRTSPGLAPGWDGDWWDYRIVKDFFNINGEAQWVVQTQPCNHLEPATCWRVTMQDIFD
jgi:DNA-binding transcriptional regulator YdaS (Cro superfamily)